MPAGPVTLEGDLSVPEGAHAVVLFAHGSGSSRHSPRNRRVAGQLHGARLATLLVDLLTPDEESADRRTGHLRFDIGLLAERLVEAADWLGRLVVVPGATHLFEEPGALDRVARLAREWFDRHLVTAPGGAQSRR